MEKTPQTIKIEAGTRVVPEAPVNFAPSCYRFAGWKDPETGEVFLPDEVIQPAHDVTLGAVWEDIRTYPDCISLSVPAYNDGFVCHRQSAVLTKEPYAGAACLKIVPMEASLAADDTVKLDGYRYKGANINLLTYKYAALILHADKTAGDRMPMLTFAAHSGKVMTRPVEVSAKTRTESGCWTIFTFDLSDIQPALGDTWDHNIGQIYMHPYGKTPLTELSDADTVYLAGLMFFTAEPQLAVETKLLSACFNEASGLTDTLLKSGVGADFADTSLSYITESGRFAAILSDTDALCNKNRRPDTAAGEAYLAKLDKQCKARIDEIRNTKTAVTITGTRYYVANDGCDENDGCSEETPWRTIDRVNAAQLKPGDGVFFKRGDLWHGVYLLAKEGVTYSAYGCGDKPKLYASPCNAADPSLWTLDFEGADGRKIWRYHEELMDIGLLVFNDGERCTTKAIPPYVDGAFRTALGTDELFDRTLHLENYQIFCDCRSMITNGVPNIYHAVGYLYLRCDGGNPGELYDSIEMNIRKQIIELGSNPNVTVDNLCLNYSGTIAVHAWDRTGNVTRRVRNLTVTNCEVGWIGGGIQFFNVKTGHVVRLGNGIEIYGGCDGYIIDNCYIYQCYDAAFTIQCSAYAGRECDGYMKNVRFSNNIVDDCIYGMEIWNGNADGLEGKVGENITVSGNIIRYCGEGFGNQRLNKGYASAIMGFNHENVFKNYVVKDNVFAKSINYLFRLSSEYRDTLPIMQGNTYVQSAGGGLGYFGTRTGSYYHYDMTAEAVIRHVFGDEHATVYYVN